MSNPPEEGSIHILIFLKRRSDITEKQMFHHWEHVHAPLVAPWAIKHGFTNYTLVCSYNALLSLSPSLFFSLSLPLFFSIVADEFSLTLLFLSVTIPAHDAHQDAGTNLRGGTTAITWNFGL